MIITSDDLQGNFDLKSFLKQQFDMNALRLLFLGLEISYDQSWYYLSQAKYAYDLVSCIGLTDSRTVHTSMESNAHFSTIDGTLIVTRPDIAHPVHIVSQFMTAHRTTHLILFLLQPKEDIVRTNVLGIY